MSSVQVKVEPGESKSASTLIEEMKLLEELQGQSGTRKAIHSELWHACAGPLVSLPQPGSLVYYFPQGHSEQVTATTRRTANAHIPSYPDLPSQMMCQIHNVTLHDDKDTDEIYAQMTLQPVNSENDVFPIPDFGLTKSKQPSEFFCKTLTASDTSTHGGFSVPRRAAERLFPQLDYSMQPPNQELAVRDLHDNSWTFRHIYRGQPKRHLLTTGWSVFVGAKRLKAGDSVLFIRDEKSQLMLGVRRANRQQTVLPSSVLSSDSMHIGVLAAAAHAAVNRSQFTIYYNPRACPSEFVIPLAKYHKAAYGTQVSIGMRFGMMFETEDSSKRRYMGTIVGISDFDPSRWPNSKWRNLQVEWDEHGCIERPDRVSFWEIETPESLFIYPSPTSSLKRAYSGSADADAELDNFMRRLFSRPPENRCGSTLYPIFPGLCSDDFMKSLKPQSMNTSFQVGCHQSIYSSMLQSLRNHEFTIASTITPAYLKRGTQLQKETACQGGKEQSHNISVHQEKLPLQNIMGENHNARLDCLKKQQLDDPDLDSQTHVPLEEINSEPLEELNVKCRNELIERKSGTWSIPNDNATRFDAMKPDKSSMPVKDKPENSQIAIMQPDQQLHAEQSIQGSGRCHGEGLAASLNPETLARRSVLNQGPDMMLDGGFQVLQSPQFETGVAQPTQLDTMSSDMFELNPLPDQSDQVSTHYMDILGWMLQPPSCQSFTRELKLPESLLRFGKTDPLICGSSHTASGSADIADVVNQENFIPVRKDQFPIPPGANTSQSPPTLAQEMLGTHLPNSTRDLPPLDEQSTSHHAFQALSSEVHDFAVQKEVAALRSFSSCYKLKDFSDESNNPNEIHSSLQFDCNGSMITDPAISSSTQEGFGTARNSSLTAPSKGMIYKFNSCHDVQSQVTSASLTDFSLQEFPDNSGGTSSSNIDGENSLLNNGSWKQVSPLRTYTKVQKLGSVGRSIDVTRFKNYSELKSAIACMFGLEGQLDDPRGSGWKLVYIDYENDILLVGDDPWEEFICCVRCIRILSPSEVQQMSHEGVQFTNNPFAYHVEQSQFLDCGQELPEL